MIDPIKLNSIRGRHTLLSDPKSQPSSRRFYRYQWSWRWAWSSVCTQNCLYSFLHLSCCQLFFIPVVCIYRHIWGIESLLLTGQSLVSPNAPFLHATEPKLRNQWERKRTSLQEPGSRAFLGCFKRRCMSPSFFF